MVRYFGVMKLWHNHLSLGTWGVPCGVVLLALSTLAVALDATQADASGTASFSVFLRGQRIGTEEVTVTKAPDGWTLSATGRTGPPLDFSFDKFSARYSPDWHVRSLEITGQMRGQAMVLNTTFAKGSAVSDVVQTGQQTTLTHPVSPSAVVLPNNFYGAYEALAQRLHTAAAGAVIPIYVAPQAEIQASISRITPRRMETSAGNFDLRQFDLSFQNPGGALVVEVWVDARGRLARLAIPAASLSVVRNDLTGVMSRLDSYSHPRDEDVFIPANGFSLAGTVTPPEGVTKPPVVILVAGSGAQDRDQTVMGIPVLGQIAGRLADNGFFVVRYDKRGVGQSGGRIESTSIEAYAEDVKYVVDWVRRRKDIDKDRVAIVGHSEGGLVAMLASSRMKGQIHALGLVATPGQTGREITLLQQRHALDRLKEPEALKQEKIALQMRIMDAVATGEGWDELPPELRRQADTMWFRSWLLFDPANVIRRTNQPILILQGSLDTQVPPNQADRLEALATARGMRTPNATRKTVVPGVNHLLVPAKTGEVDEYQSLPEKTVAAEITDTLVKWLKDVLPAKK
jgi:pimeloyl-ACP methyl ester carboxylesterase